MQRGSGKSGGQLLLLLLLPGLLLLLLPRLLLLLLPRLLLLLLLPRLLLLLLPRLLLLLLPRLQLLLPRLLLLLLLRLLLLLLLLLVPSLLGRRRLAPHVAHTLARGACMLACEHAASMQWGGPGCNSIPLLHGPAAMLVGALAGPGCTHGEGEWGEGGGGRGGRRGGGGPKRLPMATRGWMVLKGPKSVSLAEAPSPRAR